MHALTANRGIGQATDCSEGYTSRSTPRTSMANLDHADETLPITFLLVGQQSSDKGSLFRQEVLGSKIARITARSFFVTVYR
jgi:hypothetical protein